VIECLEVAEEKPIANMEVLFDDVYAEKSANILEQEESLRQHMALYPDEYSSEKH